jgi:hypothetical protein
MKLHYEMMRDDAVALTLHHFETSPSHRRMRLVLQWGLPLLCFSLLALTLRSKFGVIAGGLFTLTYALRIPVVMRRSCERQAQKLLSQEQGRRALGPHVLSVEGTTVFIEGPAGRARFERAGVEKLVETPQHVFIHLQQSGNVILVPKRTLTESEVSALRSALDTASRAQHA